MGATQTIQGRCLCGAVTVTAQTEDPTVRACHCDMCRRQTSSMFMSLATVPHSERIEGPFATYRSSEWAERGFCPVCGSTLWYGTVHDGVRNLAAGLFADAGGAPLKLEFFAELCPRGYRLAGDHKRLSSAETIAKFSMGAS